MNVYTLNFIRDEDNTQGNIKKTDINKTISKTQKKKTKKLRRIKLKESNKVECPPNTLKK